MYDAGLKVYGVSRVNKGARGNTRDLRVLSGLEEMFGQIPIIDDCLHQPR